MRTNTLRISSCLLAAALAAGGSTIALAQSGGSRTGGSIQVAQYYYNQVDRARELIVNARESASLGDYATADQLLAEASRAAPGFHEIDQARRDIAIQRADRRPSSVARSQYAMAIDNALAERRLGDADRLLNEAELRYPGDPTLRVMRARLVQARADSGWPPQRMQEARDHAAIARSLINRGDLDLADRELDRAEAQAPGLPEVIQTRAYFQRVRYGNYGN